MVAVVGPACHLRFGRYRRRRVEHLLEYLGARTLLPGAQIPELWAEKREFHASTVRLLLHEWVEIANMRAAGTGGSLRTSYLCAARRQKQLELTPVHVGNNAVRK